MYTYSPSRRHILLFAVVLLLLLVPFVLYAQGPPQPPGQIVPDCGPDPGGSGVQQVCGYCDLMLLAENVIDALIYIATVIAILMIMFAGFLYVTAGSNAGQVSRAHRVLRAAIFGLVLVLAAWLIINAIVMAVLNTNNITDPWLLPGC